MEHTKLRVLERRFSHLNRRVVGESIVYRTRGGRELFRLEGNGNRLRVPVPVELLKNLFGDLPFSVDPYGDTCVIPLDRVGDEVLLWTLLEALGEQTVDTTDEMRRANPVDLIEKSIRSMTPGEAAPPDAQTAARKSEIAGAVRVLPVQLVTRIIVGGVIALLAAFVLLSYVIGARG